MNEKEEKRPSWANHDFGRDKYGLWGEFEYEGVIQRLRWIPSGRFEMGSSEEDNNAYTEEKPQHTVIFEEGFWLFDTTVTQALWEVVMGENPSRLEWDRRCPVENISWESANRFIDKINKKSSGLNLRLPSESQWEYACRAGTTGAIYGESLDAIAWYGGNSGWMPHPVQQKQPNTWGLYDMLGNVWEWCADNWHRNYEGAPSDGSTWIKEGSTVHIRRGGSRNHHESFVRFAYRSCGPHDYDFSHTGLRCVRV